MPSLFDSEPIMPEGFGYYPDFISAEEEKILVEVVRTLRLHPLIFQGFEAKRKVESYGYDYNFDRRSISKGKEIPEGLLPIIDKAAKWAGLSPTDIAEVLVTEYPSGSVINWHRDAPPFGIIVGLSLLSDCTFKLRPYDKAKQGRKSVLSIPVSRRSIYILRGEVRDAWEHSIAPVRDIRYSITLRTLKTVQ